MNQMQKHTNNLQHELSQQLLERANIIIDIEKCEKQIID